MAERNSLKFQLFFIYSWMMSFRVNRAKRGDNDSTGELTRISLYLVLAGDRQSNADAELRFYVPT
jgi:hypothetical protein